MAFKKIIKVLVPGRLKRRRRNSREEQQTQRVQVPAPKVMRLFAEGTEPRVATEGPVATAAAASEPEHNSDFIEMCNSFKQLEMKVQSLTDARGSSDCGHKRPKSRNSYFPSKKGYVLIMYSDQPNDGTDKELLELRQTFAGLTGVTLIVKEIKTREDFDSAMETYITNQFKETSCTFDYLSIFFLFHGGCDDWRRDYISCSMDNQRIYIDYHVVPKVSNKACPGLLNKPVVLVVRACRGTKDNSCTLPCVVKALPPEASSTAHSLLASPSNLHPEQSELLIIQSTIPGAYSVAGQFISPLCQGIKEGKGVTDILKAINLKGKVKPAEGQRTNTIGRQETRQVFAICCQDHNSLTREFRFGKVSVRDVGRGSRSRARRDPSTSDAPSVVAVSMIDLQRETESEA